MGMNSEIDSYTISIFSLKEYNFDFGLNDYPIFKEEYRATLNNAILEFYMFREIGYTNPAVFRQRLRNRMDIIMRNKYNSLYSAKLKEFNPLYTMELYEDYTHSISNTGTTVNNGEVNYNTNSTINAINNQNSIVNSEEDTENNSNGLGLSSQFPSEEMTEDDLTSNLFVDNANKQTGKETGKNTTEQTSESDSASNTTNVGVDKTTNVVNGTSNNTVTESYHKKTEGSASDLTFAHAMTQFKEYVMDFNLDQLVIDELKDLFIQVW